MLCWKCCCSGGTSSCSCHCGAAICDRIHVKSYYLLFIISVFIVQVTNLIPAPERFFLGVRRSRVPFFLGVRRSRVPTVSASSSRFSELVRSGDRCRSQESGASPSPCTSRSCPIAPGGAFRRRSVPWLEPSVESLVESPVVELSLNSFSTKCSISIPRDQGNYAVHQAEPSYLVRLSFQLGGCLLYQRVPLVTYAPTAIHPFAMALTP